MRALQIVGVVLAAAALVGCGTVIQSNVRSYGAIPTKADGSRGSYYVSVQEKDKSSLERLAYVDHIRAGMLKNGFIEINKARIEMEKIRPDYLLVYHYDIEVTGQQGSYRAPMTATGGGAFAQGFNIGSSAAGGSASSRNVCTRWFSIKLLDVATVLNSENRSPVYERQVRSTGSTCDLGAVLPTIIDTAFENFPGESGKTYQVELPLTQ